eukprot:c2427_g1_i1.p1 GENE.c2427_g1_i1~~c2427_g1_i1.p1  ORF type:complete len:418 (-),score=104.73 c2427_g1_i1:374-1627(-)
MIFSRQISLLTVLVIILSFNLNNNFNNNNNNKVAEAVLISDYLTALASAVTDPSNVNAVLQQCSCLLDVVGNGTCPICNLTSCSSILSKLSSCSSTLCPASFGFCTLIINNAITGNSCANSAVLVYFPDGQSICNTNVATPNILFDGLALDSVVRSECSSLNVSSTTCQSACSATSCSSYLSGLVSCAQEGSNPSCPVALGKIRDRVVSGSVDCRDFVTDKACESYHSGPAKPYQSFDEIAPYSLSFVLSNTTINSCSCLNWTSCNFCSTATTTCNSLTTLLDCADNSLACAASSCASHLSNATDLLSSSVCNATYCSDKLVNGTILCSALEQTSAECKEGVSLIASAASLPYFKSLPTTSHSASISHTPSVTKSRSHTPSVSRTPRASSGASRCSGVVWPAIVVALATALAIFVGF